MLDRLDEFRRMAKNEGVATELAEGFFGGDEDEKNTDRELIEDFLDMAKMVHGNLRDINTTNADMKKIA